MVGVQFAGTSLAQIDVQRRFLDRKKEIQLELAHYTHFKLNEYAYTGTGHHPFVGINIIHASQYHY